MQSNIGKWRSPVAHSAGGRAVAGSNPVFPTTSTGNAFWLDLRDIREERKITLEEVKSITKIPLSVLRDLEADGLRSHDNLNAVYLGSLLEAYGRAVGIAPDLLKRSVSASERGLYDGLLARTYLGRGRVVDEPATDQYSSRRIVLRRQRRSGDSRETSEARRRESRDRMVVGVLIVLAIAVLAIGLTAGGSLPG